MKLSQDQIELSLSTYERIIEAAEGWISQNDICKRRISSLRWDGGSFQYEYNDSCHCHPSYTTESLTHDQHKALMAYLVQCELVDDPWDDDEDEPVRPFIYRRFGD